MRLCPRWTGQPVAHCFDDPRRYGRQVNNGAASPVMRDSLPPLNPAALTGGDRQRPHPIGDRRLTTTADQPQLRATLVGVFLRFLVGLRLTRSRDRPMLRPFHWPLQGRFPQRHSCLQPPHQPYLFGFRPTCQPCAVHSTQALLSAAFVDSVAVQPMPSSADFSSVDFLAWCCALGTALAFVLMPCLKVIGVRAPGLRRLSDLHPPSK